MARLLFLLVVLVSVVAPAKSYADTKFQSASARAALASSVRTEKIRCGEQEATISETTPEALMAINGKALPVASRAGEGVTVRVNLDYDEGSYSPKNFYIYNDNTFLGGSVYRFEFDGHEILIPDVVPGTYTLFASFDELYTHYGYPWTKCCVFLEDVNVDGSGTITIDPTTATNQFFGKSYMPDGEVARVDAYVYDEAGNNTYETGNCLDKLVQTSIFDTKYNAWIFNASTNSGSYTMDNYYGPGIDWNPEQMHDIMVNNISDRFVVVQQRDNYTTEGMVSTVAYSRGLSDLELSNDYNNYRSVEEFFTHTPAFDTYGSNDIRAQFTGIAYQGWNYFPYDLLTWPITIPFAAFYSTSANINDFSDFTSYYRFQLTDANADWEDYYLIGQKFIFDEDGAEYVFENFGLPSEMSYIRGLDAQGEEIYAKFPGHPGLNVKGSPFISYAYGNSAPINTVNPQVYKYNDRYCTQLNYKMTGLLGEERQADKIDMKISAIHNGDVTELTAEEWNTYWGGTPNEDASGVYQAVFNDDANVSVDGVKGYNNTTISFSYESKDMCPPAIQALQFRTADGKFAQRFETADDVNIILCAGDYEWWETVDYYEYRYESNPVTVSLEVAPHGDGEKAWTAVPLVNETEYNNLAGYGFYYKGALKDAAIGNAGGWYDLRIKVTDEAGNYNEQILGPAFKIDDNTGVEAAEYASGLSYQNATVALANGSEATFHIYSTDGKLVKSVKANSVSFDEFANGVYVVTAETANGILRTKVVK